LGQYLQGLLIFIVIQLFEYCFLFWIIGHPNWLILGILASVTTVIPYFGGLVTNIIAVILASVVSTPVFIATLAICIICPNIDGYIIGPRVYGKTNQLPALVNIFAVFAGGVIGGFWGIVLSLPVAIILIATYKFFISSHK
jgi:predicted PurR-regulated permease PerM